MIRQKNGHYYAYFSQRIRDPKAKGGYRVTTQYGGPLGTDFRRATMRHNQKKLSRKKTGGSIDLFNYIDVYLNSYAFKKLNNRTKNLEQLAFKYFKIFCPAHTPPISKLHQVEPQILSDFKDYLVVKQGQSGALTNRNLRVIIKILHRAERSKDIDIQPWSSAGREKEYKGKKNPYTWEETLKLLYMPSFFWYGVSCLGVMCGLRRAEFQNLTIYDIEIKHWTEQIPQEVLRIVKNKIVKEIQFTQVPRIGGIVKIRKKQKSQAEGITHDWQPKDSEERDINLTEWAAIWLEQAITRAKVAGTIYIFNIKGGRMSDDYLTSWYKYQAVAQGVNNPTVHRLRHTFGTAVGEISGAAEIQKAMGHSNLATSQGYMNSRTQATTMNNLQQSFAQNITQSVLQKTSKTNQ